MSLLDKLKQVFGFEPTGPTTSAPSAPQPKKPAESSGAGEIPVESSAPAYRPPTGQSPAGLPPAAQRRDQVLRFILSRLRAYQNEPDTAPIGLQLVVQCNTTEEEELYQVVLWASQPGRFQKELNRLLADNYITLPKNWRFEFALVRDGLPDGSQREGNLALVVENKVQPVKVSMYARIVTLAGQTEQSEYPLNPADKTSYCIGRGHTTQTTSGRVRTNDIVVLNDDDPNFDPQRGAGNGAVSRAHATIRYDKLRNQYSLLVDPGGLPASGNKTKIMHPDDSTERADIAGVGYPLQDGDQIELGGEVVLLFEHR